MRGGFFWRSGVGDVLACLGLCMVCYLLVGANVVLSGAMYLAWANCWFQFCVKFLVSCEDSDAFRSR